ncbi:hypothetical protein J2W51_001609 [Tardiphaga robiniae]|uniref:hypothetical protein n=1 Tax=Tardiphaga robiniae TaxID=943830 RepID=UPI00285BB638|nr:hypothetical protein [Tardiphaga robiniae]MDR6659067.1 hypothetical protein [Tardiphaga robiniae]
MKRASLPKAVLEHVALVELRALSGCGNIAEVFVERDPQAFGEANWRIVRVRNGGEQAITCDHAHRDVARGISVIQRKLRQQYDLLFN